MQPSPPLSVMFEQLSLTLDEDEPGDSALMTHDHVSSPRLKHLEPKKDSTNPLQFVKTL